MIEFDIAEIFVGPNIVDIKLSTIPFDMIQTDQNFFGGGSTSVKMVFPFAPHIGSEVYEAVTGTRVWEEPWPEADPALLESDTFTLIVQVNGKLRDKVEASADAAEDELLELARGSERVRSHIEGRDTVKEVVVPGKLVNLVVR